MRDNEPMVIFTKSVGFELTKGFKRYFHFSCWYLFVRTKERQRLSISTLLSKTSISSWWLVTTLTLKFWTILAYFGQFWHILDNFGILYSSQFWTITFYSNTMQGLSNFSCFAMRGLSLPKWLVFFFVPQVFFFAVVSVPGSRSSLATKLPETSSHWGGSQLNESAF